MPQDRLSFPLALSLVLTAVVWTYPSTAQARTEAYFARNTNLTALLAGELHDARRIDVTLPNFTDEKALTLLRRAARQGKQVRLLSSARGLSTPCEPCARLARAGVDIRLVANAVADNFVLLDGPRGRLANGDHSRLLVYSSAPQASGSVVRFTKEGDYVLAYQDEFNHVYSKARSWRGRTRPVHIHNVRVPPAPYVLFSSANMVPIELPDGWIFTPALDAHAGVIGTFTAGAIDHAYNTVDLAAHDLHRATVYAALERALARGVRVRLVLDSGAFQGTVTSTTCAAAPQDGSALLDECLAARGADVRYLETRRNRPAPENFVVIDGHIALAGSFTWSAPDEFQTFANLLMLQGRVARTYTAEMNRLIRTATTPFGRLAQETHRSLSTKALYTRP